MHYPAGLKKRADMIHGLSLIKDSALIKAGSYVICVLRIKK